MATKAELRKEVDGIFRSAWKERDGTVVPDDTSVGLKNDGVNLDATVLYADLSESTGLVENKTKYFAAEVYKSYLSCAARIIRDNGGVITAYDGDRIMAVYIGNTKNTSAVTTALKINYAVINIINPALADVYGPSKYEVKQVIGVDTSKIMVAKTGVRGSNDLVWVGRAANLAAKLSNLSGRSTYITSDVYNNMHETAKFSGSTNMWEARSWTAMGGRTIYCSSYYWSIA